MTYELPVHGELDWDVKLSASVEAVKATADAAETPTGAQDKVTTHAEDTSSHGVLGAIVGASDTQALTNKDLSSATNTFPSSLATDAEVTAAVSTHAAVTATHGVTGAIVGTTDTQTLTNKDLTSSSNTYPSALATLLNKPLCVLGDNSGPTLATGTWTKLTFNRELADTSGMYTGDTYITATVAGWYQVYFKVVFTVNNTGYRACQIWKNDTLTHGAHRIDNLGAQQTFMNTSVLIDLSVGDKISCAAWQNSGGNLSLATGGGTDNSFEQFCSVEWVRPL